MQIKPHRTPRILFGFFRWHFQIALQAFVGAISLLLSVSVAAQLRVNTTLQDGAVDPTNDIWRQVAQQQAAPRPTTQRVLNNPPAQRNLPPSVAPGQPKWEAGLIMINADTPHYPGSDQSQFRTLILPDFVYRGPVVRMGEGGIRAVAIENLQYEFGVSVNFGFDVNSKNNRAREGLPNLPFLVEVGPRLALFHTPRNAPRGWSSRLQLRSVLGFPSLFEPEYVGLIFNPQTSLFQRGILGKTDALIASLGLNFTDSGVANYLYGVDAQYVTSSRGAYQGKGGYLGTDLSLVYSLAPFDNKLRFNFVLKYSDLSGSANQDSPLFKTTSNTTVGVIVNWRPWKSTELVEQR